MPLTKAVDVAYVRFEVPEPGVAERWFTDFGLKRVEHNHRGIFMRGAGADPFLYVAEPSFGSGFLGLGLKAESRGDLKKIAEAEGAAIEELNAPGGGEVVRIQDPDGLGVEVVFGQTPAPPMLAPRPPQNNADVHARLRATKRLRAGPSQVVRLGHVVLGVTDFRRSERWYKERFGFLTSDEIIMDDGKTALGAFLRCDRGDQPTDHHTLFLLQSPQAGFNHAAFEVRDFDDLMTGHDHLKGAGAAHTWGVGRHILGSQIFDYWNDPWGNTMEHWTDGDLFTADRPPATATVAELAGSQWGPALKGRVG